MPDTAESAIIREAIEILRIEAEGILGLINRLDQGFDRAVELIFAATGRLIVSGIGKSGIVGRKIVATLNSTGTRAFFLHPVEAMHGDLGMVCPDDVFLALSNSGETAELNMLLASIQNIGCQIVAFTGDRHSTLARHSNIVIDVGVQREACSLGLAPTASTTAMLAMGDALAIILLNKKHFNAADFKRFHPGGKLGRRLAGRVRELMLTGLLIPRVPCAAPMRLAIEEMERLQLGATLVVNPDDTLAGIITDGDIRRAVARQRPIFDLNVDDLMTADPQHARMETAAYDALNLMEIHQITVLPVVDSAHRVKGIVHLHDILGKGEFKFNGAA